MATTQAQAEQTERRLRPLYGKSVHGPKLLSNTPQIWARSKKPTHNCYHAVETIVMNLPDPGLS